MIKKAEKTSIDLWKNSPIPITGVIWLTYFPFFQSTKRKSLSLDFGGSSDSPTPFGWWSDPTIIIKGLNWDIIETKREVCISRISDKENYPRSQSASKQFRKPQLQQVESFIQTSDQRYLIPDFAVGCANFELIDLVADSLDKVSVWKVECPVINIKTYSASSDLLVWIGQEPEIGEFKNFSNLNPTQTLGSITLRSKSDEWVKTRLGDLLQSANSEHSELMAASKSNTIKNQVFASKNKIAWYCCIKKEGEATSSMFAIIKPNFSNTRHILVAHSLHYLEQPGPLPKLLFFAKPKIHALMLSKDTSGHLFRHEGSRVLLVSKWKSLPQMVNLWPGTRPRDLQFAWNPRRRAVVIVNSTYVDWQRQGDPSIIEISLKN